MATGGTPAIMNVKESDSWVEDALKTLLEVGLTVGGGMVGAMAGPAGASLGAGLGQQLSAGITGEQMLPSEVASAIGTVGTLDTSKFKNPFTDPDPNSIFGKIGGALESPAPVEEKVPTFDLNLGQQVGQPLPEIQAQTPFDAMVETRQPLFDPNVPGVGTPPRMSSGIGDPNISVTPTVMSNEDIYQGNLGSLAAGYQPAPVPDFPVPDWQRPVGGSNYSYIRP